MVKRDILKSAASFGFTLVELLVVISIIAMLMSIMVPALGKARKAGRQVVCSSNLKQLTLAWQLYAVDNGDRLCSSNPIWKYSWANGYDLENIPEMFNGTELSISSSVLWPYTQSIKLYECPSADGYESVHSHKKRLRDYSMSRTMGYPWNNWWDGTQINSFKTLGSITRPSDKMVLIGADGGLMPGEGLDHWELCWAFWPIKEGLNNIIWTFPRTDHDISLSWNIITARHNGGCNLSFADGHVDYWRYKDKRTLKLAIEETDIQDEIDASVNNPDLDYMVRILKGPGE